MLKVLFILLISISSFGQTYNCAVTSQIDTFVRDGATTLVLNKKVGRRCLQLQNKIIIGDAQSTVWVKFLPFGMTTASTSFTGASGFYLASGAPWMPIILPVNAIYMKSNNGTLPVSIIEGE